VRKVVEKGAGAAMLRDLEKMQKITAAVVKATSLPVTVKTRLGWDDKSKNILEAALRIQDAGAAALSIHGRTRAQLYGGVADWTLIGEVKNHPSIHIPIIGNGDIDSAEKAAFLLSQYGVDGLMIGRAAIGNPWIFKQCRSYLDSGITPQPPSLNERIGVCRLHLSLAIKAKGESRAIHEMRKHYTNYFRSLTGIKSFRNRLVTAPDIQSVEKILGEIQAFYT
jgi:nifR3 family TIM-barrel protein